MPSFARIQNGVVAEVLTVPRDVKGLFHPALIWVPVPNGTAVVQGWSWDGAAFHPPGAQASANATPAIQRMQDRISALEARITALAAKQGPGGAGVSAPPGAAGTSTTSGGGA